MHKFCALCGVVVLLALCSRPAKQPSAGNLKAHLRKNSSLQFHIELTDSDDALKSAARHRLQLPPATGELVRLIGWTHAQNEPSHCKRATEIEREGQREGGGQRERERGGETEVTCVPAQLGDTLHCNCHWIPPPLELPCMLFCCCSHCRAL